MGFFDWLSNLGKDPYGPEFEQAAAEWARTRFPKYPHGIASKIVSVTAEQLGVDVSALTHEARFVDDLDIETLQDVELIMAIEEEFGFTIPAEEAELISTFGELMEYVDRRLRSGSAEL